MVTPHKTRRGFFVVSLMVFLALFVVLQSSEVNASEYYTLDDFNLFSTKYDGTLNINGVAYSSSGKDFYKVSLNTIITYYKTKIFNIPYNVSEISTSSPTTYTSSITTTDFSDITILNNGSNLYLIDTINKKIYHCPTSNYDFTIVTDIANNCEALTVTYTPERFFVKDDNTLFVGGSDRFIYEYSHPKNLSEASFVQKSVLKMGGYGFGFLNAYQVITFYRYNVNTPTVNNGDFVIFNLTTPFNISSAVLYQNGSIASYLEDGININLDFTETDVFLTMVDSSSDNVRVFTVERRDVVNTPPNVATDIQPFNTTITLNSSGVSFPINWSGGDDNNSDTVTTSVYIDFLGTKTFIGNTTTQTITATLNNSYTTSSFYNIYLSLSDGVNTTISEGGNFALCSNDWIPYNTTCESNLQTLLYNDSNSCPLQYDLPLDNGTVSACDIGTGTGTSVDVELNIDYVFIILLIITAFLIFTAFATKSLTIFFLSIVFISLLTITFYNTYEETLILVGGALAVLSLLIALMKNYV